MAIELNGNWTKGFALDHHMQKSILLGYDELGHPHFDSKRSVIGEWVYQLKYRNQTQNVSLLVDYILQKFSGLESINLIVPAPFTTERINQPVQLIAKELSDRLNIPYSPILRKSSSHTPLKNIEEKSEKLEILNNSITIDNIDLSNKNILVIDDLFDSGATLEISTEKLFSKNARSVIVLAMTKTR
ncbi:TPA: ComF family protein, partial [Neisseria gonorrhoeae]